MQGGKIAAAIQRTLQTVAVIGALGAAAPASTPAAIAAPPAVNIGGTVVMGPAAAPSFQHGGTIVVGAPAAPAIAAPAAALSPASTQPPAAPAKLLTFWATPGEEIFVRPSTSKGFATGGSFTVPGGGGGGGSGQGNVVVNVIGADVPADATQTVNQRQGAGGDRFIDVIFESKLRQSFRNRSMDSLMGGAFGARRLPVARS